MCGRYDFHGAPLDVEALLGQPVAHLLSAERYNIAPTQLAPLIHLDPATGRLTAAPMRFGRPNPRGGLLVNARSENITRTPLYRDALRHGRALVPANGFYEWQKLPDGKKQPYYFHPRGARAMVFAALWDKTEAGAAFVILTTQPNEAVAPIHNRMPVILPAADVAAWLAPGTDPAHLRGLLRRAAPEALVAHPVSAFVSHAANDSPACIAPLSP
jgi:putative SOS response-associated peptidase YedK